MKTVSKLEISCGVLLDTFWRGFKSSVISEGDPIKWIKIWRTYVNKSEFIQLQKYSAVVLIPTSFGISNIARMSVLCSHLDPLVHQDPWTCALSSGLALEFYTKSIRLWGQGQNALDNKTQESTIMLISFVGQCLSACILWSYLGPTVRRRQLQWLK